MKRLAILDCDVGFEGQDALWIGEKLKDYMPSIYRARENIFPDASDYDGVIISGSSASVNDTEPWIRNLESHISEWYDNEIPMLGVCFGHQAMAKALGGEVSRMDSPEIGWYNIGFDHNPLFYGMSNPFKSFQTHSDEVKQYPLDSIIIAENGTGQAFQMSGKPVYGVQFHPEMDWRSAQYVLEERKDQAEKITGKPIEDLNDIGMLTAKQPNSIFGNFEKILDRWYK